jgi:hypothetical protein
VSGVTTVNFRFPNDEDLSGATQVEFRFDGTFTTDLSGWDVSAVESLNSALSGSSGFAGTTWTFSDRPAPLTGPFDPASDFRADVSKSTSASSTLADLRQFDSDLSSWDASGAVILGDAVVSRNTDFRLDVSQWDVS